MPFYRYAITERGKVEIGILTCARCETRVMPNGTLIKGLRVNFPFDRVLALDYRSSSEKLDDGALFDEKLPALNMQYFLPYATRLIKFAGPQ